MYNREGESFELGGEQRTSEDVSEAEPVLSILMRAVLK